MTSADTIEPTGRHVKRKNGLTRSKSGCLTCRKRRKKCEGETPICGHCNRLGLECHWPCSDEVRSRSSTSPLVRRIRSKVEYGLSPNVNGRGQSFEEYKSSIVHVDSLEMDRDGDVHRAAEALLVHRDYASAYIPNAASESPYRLVKQLPTSVVAPLTMKPTEEDLLAAQWLSGYRDEDNSRQLPNNDPQSTQNFGLQDAFYSSFVPARSRSSCSPEEERRFFLGYSSFQHVDHTVRILLDYFETELAQLISVAPKACNDLLKVFMPMAISNVGVRSAIAGWSATHLRDIDEMFTSHSQIYLGEAASWLDRAIASPDERHQDTTLAVALIICAVEVCKDSDSEWTRYRSIAHDIIRHRDLINSYSNRDHIFLLKNFAYHDVMSSSAPRQFCADSPDLESQIILSTIPNVEGPDVYMGICSSLYRIISEVTSLSANAARDKWPPNAIAIHATRLIFTIDACEPPPGELLQIPWEDHPKHLAMFKILQITAKLYINQVLLQYKSTSAGSQILLKAILPLFSSLQTVLVEMLFPLFIVGVDSLADDRLKVGRMLEIMFERFRIGNVRCAFTVLEKCWETNRDGDKYVNWNEISWGLFGQCISFA